MSFNNLHFEYVYLVLYRVFQKSVPAIYLKYEDQTQVRGLEDQALYQNVEDQTQVRGLEDLAIDQNV